MGCRADDSVGCSWNCYLQDAESEKEGLWEQREQPGATCDVSTAKLPREELLSEDKI